MRSSGRWAWWSLFPLGLAAWLPIYAGVRMRRPALVVAGVLCSGVVVVGWALSSGDERHNSFAGFLILAGWAGAVATSFVARARRPSALEPAEETAKERIDERREARRLAREQPEVALEMGIGRPDVPGAADAGLVDVNHASAAALARLPGVDDALARVIVAGRERVDGFDSLEDMGAVLDLPGDVVEDLRGATVFLPR